MMRNTLLDVLLVEDNLAMAELITSYLEGMFRVRHVVSLSGALQVVRATRPDAVLLDLSLPDSDGLDTVTRLKTAAEQVPIIVLTGHSDHLLAIAAVQRGAHDYLVKSSADADVLRDTIHAAAEAYRDSPARPVTDRIFVT